MVSVIHDLRGRAAPVDGQLVILDGDRARVLGSAFSRRAESEKKLTR